MKKAYLFSLIVLLALVFTSVVFAADKAATAPKAKQGPVAPRQSLGQRPTDSRGAMRSNFNMMVGTVSKMDMADPANVKMEVKDERDNQIHTIEVTPATNVTKSTEISEIKVGDTVRVMARKVDDKEVAMGVMFGKFKRLPPSKFPPAAEKPEAQTPPPAAKTETKK